MNPNEPFRNELAKFVYLRTYARWSDELGRREFWKDTVDRTTDFLYKKAGNALTAEQKQQIYSAIYNHEVMPSMRLMWSAGEAAERENMTVYNCSYQAINNLQCFPETLYILMCGTGAGYSVESEYVEQLPRIIKQKKNAARQKIVVEDSRFGWANAFAEAIEVWYAGHDCDVDYSKLRPHGARLITMGGRSSGPDPLRRLMEFVRSKIVSRQGRRLRPIDAHDILCMVGEVVVAGGVRRSSEISLSDLDDQEMRRAKFGAFYNSHPYRAMANNSVAYSERPNSTDFMEEFLSLAQSGSGERGIFNRDAADGACERRGKIYNAGTNPCGEILLRGTHPQGGGGLCNLSEVVARPGDTAERLLEKVRIATIIGTIQATLTDFNYLRDGWKLNAEEERLLGVSITGQADCRALTDPKLLKDLRIAAEVTNGIFSARLGLNDESSAITCVKPSGTVSQLVDSSSGLHVRWSPYYIRRIRISATDPLFKMARDQGVPAEPEVGQDPSSASTWVLAFPIASPKDAITRNDVTALDQLETWKRLKVNYTEHNPSCTVYVEDHEWPIVMGWVWDNWDIIGGLSFLPKENSVYRLAPYEEIDELTYHRLTKEFPKLDYSKLSDYENSDQTTGARDYSCVGGACSI